MIVRLSVLRKSIFLLNIKCSYVIACSVIVAKVDFSIKLSVASRASEHPFMSGPFMFGCTF